MIVNYENEPKNSIIYTSSIIISTLNRGIININNINEHCNKLGMEPSLFFLSIDWLYLIGYIKSINTKNEVII